MRRWNWYRLAIWACGLIFVIYMIVIPTVGWLLESKSPPESGGVVEEMTLLEKIRLRTMEAMAATWFFAFGATVGSFLNVVAYRLPRGESVAFRRSCCPKCETQIKGRDNVPILGWLLLGGRCRSCDTVISKRYPIVETIAAVLFLFLYYVELISGGANIPVRLPNMYKGVVWIVFYTEWDLVGLYLYHCFALSTLLAIALIDFDRQRVPTRAKWLIAAMLLIPPIIWPDLLPVPCFRTAASWLQPAWLETGVTSLVGGIVGAAVGRVTGWGIESRDPSHPDPESPSLIAACLGVVGLSLGWQAAVAVALMTLLFRLPTTAVAYLFRWPIPRFSSVLLAAFVVHQALWRWTIENVPRWWPSHQTTLSGWCVVTLVYVVLLLANRRLVQRKNTMKYVANSSEEFDATETPQEAERTPDARSEFSHDSVNSQPEVQSEEHYL